MRKYFNPDKRIIILNICLIISHVIILNELNNISFKPTIQIEYFKANIQREGFTHQYVLKMSIKLRARGLQNTKI